MNWLKLDEVDHLASIEDRAEVMEVTYPYACETGRVRELGAPPKSLIGAILRKDKIIIPHGDTTIQHGDHLFVVTTPDNVGGGRKLARAASGRLTFAAYRRPKSGGALLLMFWG